MSQGTQAFFDGHPFTSKQGTAHTFLFSDSSISAVSQWTGLSVTLTRHIVFISTKCLCRGPVKKIIYTTSERILDF